MVNTMYLAQYSKVAVLPPVRCYVDSDIWTFPQQTPSTAKPGYQSVWNCESDQDQGTTQQGGVNTKSEPRCVISRPRALSPPLHWTPDPALSISPVHTSRLPRSSYSVPANRIPEEEAPACLSCPSLF